jgi:ferrous iron transport protein B
MIILFGLIYKKFNGQNETNFIMSLTNYQFPVIKHICKNVGMECKMFVKKAGKIIIIISMFIWLLMVIHIPFVHHQTNNVSNSQSQTTVSATKNPLIQSTNDNKSVLVQDSAFYDITKYLTVVLKPTGFGNSNFTAAILTGIAAKEAVVGTITTSFETSTNDPHNLNAKIEQALDKSSNGHSDLAAFSFMLFVLIYVPCMATVGQSARIFGKRFALKSSIFSILLAYIISTLVFQIFSRI